MLSFSKAFAVIVAALLLAACASLDIATESDDSPSLSIMTFNILRGGTELGQPLSKTAEVIERGGAQVVILEERGTAVAELCSMLGYDAVGISDSVAILSAFPIEKHGRYGARVALPTGDTIYVFGVHLEAYPYGPLRSARRPYA